MRKVAYLTPLALAVALLCVPQSPAGCRRVAAYQAPAYTPPVVVTPVVAAAFIQVPVATYPVFGATYSQGDVAAEIRALRQSLEKLAAPALAAAPRTAPPALMPREQAGPETMPAAAPPAVVAASCIKCHGATNPKGGVSLAGDVPLLTKLKAFRAAATGVMPPTPARPVSDADLEGLAKWSE